MSLIGIKVFRVTQALTVSIEANVYYGLVTKESQWTTPSLQTSFQNLFDFAVVCFYCISSRRPLSVEQKHSIHSKVVFQGRSVPHPFPEHLPLR